jgi:phosphoserine phosphatase RsbU/P
MSDARRLASLDHELAIARDIQASILPQAMPRLDGLRIAAVYRPMTSVAGDFYDFIDAGANRVGVLVADVSGHGVPAALIASMVKVALAAQQTCAERPAEVLAGINRVLYGRLGGQYVTAAYAFVDVSAGIVRYAAAGHPPMLRVRQATRQADTIEENGLLLGFIEDAAYQTREEQLAVGDRLLLYTDGLFEAENEAGDDYGLDRVRASLAAAAALPPAGAVDAIVKAMNDWSNRPALDDLTIVLIERVESTPVSR